MKFESLILAAELNPDDYPALANLEVELFDRKKRLVTWEVDDIKSLFSNERFLYDFKLYLDERQKKIASKSSSLRKIQVRFTDDFLIIFSSKNTIDKALRLNAK